MMIMIDRKTRTIRFQSVLRDSLRTPFDCSDLGIFSLLHFRVRLSICRHCSCQNLSKTPLLVSEGEWFFRRLVQSALSLFGVAGVLSGFGALSAPFSVWVSVGCAEVLSSWLLDHF